MTGASDPTLTLRLPNRLGAIPQAAEAIAAFCRENGVPQAASGHLNQAIDEAVTNTIDYGWPDGGDHEVTIALTIGANMIEAVISDNGVAFNPLRMPPPDLEADIDMRPIGGLGVHLVKSLMDSVDYRHEGGRNVLTMRKTFVRAG